MALSKKDSKSILSKVTSWLGTKSEKPKLLVVLGPTATGKSDLAVDIALHLQKKLKLSSGVISADSRQVYTGLDIGSGKITKKEKRGVPHYCLDIVSPRRKKMFSVAEFQKEAGRRIDQILQAQQLPILCGGTGFYIDAIVDGTVFPEVSENAELRKKLAGHTTEKLFSMLKKLDARRAGEIDPHNKVRLIRAIEIAKAIGKVPELKNIQKYDTFIVGLDTADGKDEILKKRVKIRIEKRVKAGMVKEAVRLRAEGLSFKRMRQFGLEYAHLADLLQDKVSKNDFAGKMAIDIWHYVKRQRAWFRRRSDIEWFSVK